MANNQTAADTSSTLVPPRLVRIDESTNDDLECSLHYLPKPLLREFGHVFNDEYLKFDTSSGGDVAMSDAAAGSSSRLLAIPTNQRAREDLVAVGDHIEEEKDRLLNVVSAICLCSVSLLSFHSQTLTTHVEFMYECSFLPLASMFASNCDQRDFGQTTSIHVPDCQ